MFSTIYHAIGMQPIPWLRFRTKPRENPKLWRLERALGAGNAEMGLILETAKGLNKSRTPPNVFFALAIKTA
jgi:hypothetical protein